jgi:hypothetical protein
VDALACRFDGREVRMFLLSDGGFAIEFEKDGHVTPIALSQKAMNAVVALHDQLTNGRWHIEGTAHFVRGCTVSEDFDAAQSRFLDYIDLDVNPDRIAKGLPPIDADTAREAYRLIAQPIIRPRVHRDRG